MRATLGRVSPLLTELRNSKAGAEEPKAELTNEVELWVDRAPDGRVVAFALRRATCTAAVPRKPGMP